MPFLPVLVVERVAARGRRLPAWTPAKPGPDEGLGGRLFGDAHGLGPVGSRVVEVRRTGGRRPCASPLHSPACWTCPGIWVRKVAFCPDRVVVTVVLRRKKLVCPKCSYSTMARENEQDHDSVWRHLDLGIWRLEVRARLRRLRCPEHGVHVEGVPFARDGARFTRDFEDLVAWLMTKTDRTAVCRLVRIDWETVGRIIKRVGDELLPCRPSQQPV